MPIELTEHVTLDGHNWPRVRVAANGNKRYICTLCGTWICVRCGHFRSNANRAYPGAMSCAKCGCLVGEWRVVYHGRATWSAHNEADPETGETHEETRAALAAEYEAARAKRERDEHGGCGT